jgi:hypothetical protein
VSATDHPTFSLPTSRTDPCIIAQGLRNKDITWAYLFSDNFMRIATYSWVPLQYVLEALEFTVLPAEVKVSQNRRRLYVKTNLTDLSVITIFLSQPSLQGLTEVIVEHFWRVIGLPGQRNYDPAVAAMLRRHGVMLPFTYSRKPLLSMLFDYVLFNYLSMRLCYVHTDCYEDEFRLWTHRMQAPYPPCACWGCQVRPYKSAREREAWEGEQRIVPDNAVAVS